MRSPTYLTKSCNKGKKCFRFIKLSKQIWILPPYYSPKQYIFLTFPACFLIPINFSNLNSNCYNLSYLKTLWEQVKKAYCYQKISDFSLFSKLFYWSQNFCKFSAFSLEFHFFFSITRIIQSISRSEQFWLQNTISYLFSLL